jgi:Mrp family chromosome partitioning ATPase
MGKIYEALEHAREASRGLEVLTESGEPVPSALPLSSMFPQVNMEEEMVRLHQNLDTLLPQAKKRVVQFIGSREGEGTSTVVREFARVSATRFGQRVLLLDTDRHAVEGDPLFTLTPEHHESEAYQGEDLTDLAPYQIANSSLFISAVPLNSGSAWQNGNSPRAEAFWERLRQNFDLVLVDSPPAASSADGLAISSKVDGVIIVVEAERTRWPVAESTRDSIERSGGKILGIVFNKRRYYIPRFIYSRL